MEVFIFLSQPDTSNSRVDFSTDGSSRPDRIVTIRRDICSFPGSSTSGSRAYFLFKLHDPTSGESGRQQQLTTRLSSCILDMCAPEGDVFNPEGFVLPHFWDYLPPEGVVLLYEGKNAIWTVLVLCTKHDDAIEHLSPSKPHRALQNRKIPL